MPAGDSPQTLFIWNTGIVLETLSDIYLYSLDGKVLFKKERAHGTRIGLNEEYLFCQDQNHWLTSFDFSGKLVLEEADFPHSTSFDFPVSLFVPCERGFFAVIQYTGGAENLPPEAYVEKVEYGQVLPEWTWKVEGKQQLYPLYIEETGRIVVFLEDIILIDSQTGEEISRIGFPKMELFNCSADQEGNIYLTGADKDGAVLVALSPGGEELWRLTDGSGEKMIDIHPPVVASEDMVYLLMERSVFAISNGDIKWSFRIESGDISYGTSLADGTFLVTVENRLYRLGSDGDVIFEYTAELKIEAPPVVDADGDIYLVTAEKMIKIG